MSEKLIKGLTGSDMVDRMMAIAEAIEGRYIRVVHDPSRKAHGTRIPDDLNQAVADGLNNAVLAGIIHHWPGQIEEIQRLGLAIEAIETANGSRRRLADATVQTNRRIAQLVTRQLVDGQLVQDMLARRRGM